MDKRTKQSLSSFPFIFSLAKAAMEKPRSLLLCIQEIYRNRTIPKPVLCECVSFISFRVCSTNKPSYLPLLIADY